MYCRYLLTHLHNPLYVIGEWATQLQSTGLLLIEEVEWIRTNNTIFETYLNIVAAMLADQSTELYVGPMLDSVQETDLLKKSYSQVKHYPVLTHQAATMFYMNIQTWKHQSFVRANYTTEMITELELELKNLMMTAKNASDIEWGLRQLVFQRW